jgi:prevent-host-death family protein
MEDTDMDRMKVTAADVGKNFGQFADKALVEPVTITKYGREHLVLLSAEEYARLKRRDRQVYRVEDLPAELAEAIARAEPLPESEDFNEEYPAKSDR